MHLGKEEDKPSLFTGDTILCLKDPSESTRRLLNLINAVKLSYTKSVFKNKRLLFFIKI